MPFDIYEYSVVLLVYPSFTYLQEPQTDLLCWKQIIHNHRKPPSVTPDWRHLVLSLPRWAHFFLSLYFPLSRLLCHIHLPLHRRQWWHCCMVCSFLSLHSSQKTFQLSICSGILILPNNSISQSCLPSSCLPSSVMIVQMSKPCMWCSLPSLPAPQHCRALLAPGLESTHLLKGRIFFCTHISETLHNPVIETLQPNQQFTLAVHNPNNRFSFAYHQS